MIINITKKDLIWSYLGYFLQMCANIILLPIILKNINDLDLGLWYTFASVGNLVNLLDMGFSPTLTRNITYAWSGAKQLTKEGLLSENSKSSEPNMELFCKVLRACKYISMLISLLAIIILLFAGTPYILYVTRNNYNNMYIVAWVIYCAAIFINIYYNYWTTTLKGIGAIMQSQKAVVFSNIVYLLFCFIGISLGYGLIAMSIGFLLKGIALRIPSKLYLYNYNNIGIEITQRAKFKFIKDILPIIKLVWFNAKKTGMVSICGFIITQANTIICSAFIGLAMTASYGLCLQIINLIRTVSNIYYTANEPKIVSYRVADNKEGLKKIYSSSVIIYWGMFWLCMILVSTIGIPLLGIIKSNTAISISMLFFMGTYIFLEGNHSIAANFIATKNEVPYLRSSVWAAAVIGIGSFLLAKFTHNIYSLMAIQCIVQLCYANWKWPYVVLKQLDMNIKDIFTTGLQYMYTFIKKK